MENTDYFSLQPFSLFNCVIEFDFIIILLIIKLAQNCFRYSNILDRMPDGLWTEVHDIVQETGIKTIPMGKKCKKAKWLSEEALQIGVKRREVKSKGEKERYSHLNAEFQRIARRDK